jgi:uncharacterized protein YdhG (YjbR/CyaY superfamily)
MGSRKKYASMKEYLADLPPEPRRRLNKVRQLVKKQVPGAVEAISYNIPAFRLDKVFMYCAAFKNHISIFPPLRNEPGLDRSLEPYRNARGNLLFDLRVPMPYSLIARVAKALARRGSGKGGPASKRRKQTTS